MTLNITFRPICDGDQTFLKQVYASTRQEELKHADWDDVEKDAFLAQQFYFQHQYYKQQFENAEFLIILKDQKPIGRLYVDRNDFEDIRLIDIALLPEHCNQGIGTSLIKDLMQDSQKCGKPIRIYVEQYNPALRLYQRLNFKKVGENGAYFLMKWFPTENEHLTNQPNG